VAAPPQTGEAGCANCTHCPRPHGIKARAMRMFARVWHCVLAWHLQCARHCHCVWAAAFHSRPLPPNHAAKGGGAIPKSAQCPPKATQAQIAHWVACDLRKEGLACGSVGCTECYMIAFGRRLKGMLPLHNGTETSWVGCRNERIGCDFCMLYWTRKAKSSNARTQGLKNSLSQKQDAEDFYWIPASTTRKSVFTKLKRHARSQQHIRAVRAVCGLGTPVGAPLTQSAPRADAFRVVLEEKRKGTSTNKMPGHRHKSQKLLWCLGEAVARWDRAFARKSATAVAHPDSGCGRHLVRFAFGCTDVTSRRGILGQVAPGSLRTRLQGGDKLSIAFVQAMKDFCTIGFGAPPTAKKRPMVDEHLLRKCQQTFVVYDPDGAADAASAGLSLERKRFGTNVDIRARLRDHTHAARRVLMRPEAADNFTNRVAQLWVFSKDSPLQLMEHSQVFRDIVADIMAREQHPILRDTPKLTNMSAKKHRYEKCSTPIAKASLWSRCLILGAIRVVLTQVGPPSLQSRLKRFLAEVDTENTHTLGPMADEGDDGLLLVRFFDTEALDPAHISSTLEEFRQRVDALYVRGAALNQGFTKLVRDLYQDPLLIPSAASGVPDKVIKVPCGRVQERLLKRMHCWGAMALNVVHAEFPEWELLQSTSVFHLSASRSAHCLHGEAADQEANEQIRLRRVQQFVQADEIPFQDQYKDMRPLAQWHKENGPPGVSNVECWRLAKAEFDSSAKKSKKWALEHPTHDIEKGLAAYAAWHGCVTSGTESGHSIFKKNIGGRECLGLPYSTGELRLLSDPPEDDAVPGPHIRICS